MRMIIALGADHAGYELKVFLTKRLRELGFETLDFGAQSEAPYDYPDAAFDYVILSQTLALMLQRVERSGGDDAGLAHATSELFSESLRAEHRLLVAG